MKDKALVAALGRRGRRGFLPGPRYLPLPPAAFSLGGGSGCDSVHPHSTPSRPPRHPRAHSVAPEGKLSGAGDVPGAGLSPSLKALTLPQLRTPPYPLPIVRVQLSGAGLLGWGRLFPKRRRGDEPRAPLSTRCSSRGLGQ